MQLKKFLEFLEEKTIRLGAFVRVLSRQQKPLLTKIISLSIKSTTFSEAFYELVDKEVDRIGKERAEVIAESQKEIDKIKAKAS